MHLHLPHLSDNAKHHLYLGGAAIIILGGLWAIAHKDSGTASELGLDGSALPKTGTGGFLSKLLGGGGGNGGGNFSFTLPGLPSGGGNTGGSGDVQSYNNTYVSNTPPPSAPASNPIVSFIAALVTPTPASDPVYTAPDPTVHINQVIAQEAATVDTYGPRPEVTGYGYTPQPGIFAPGINPDTGNPINPLTGGDVTPQDLANLGQTGGAVLSDPATSGYAEGSPADYYSQPGYVDSSGQTWVGGSPPTT